MRTLLTSALKQGLITPDQIRDAATRRITSLDNPGFCLSCGEELDGFEPDAREGECEVCGEHTVYGAEDLLFEL